MDLDEAFCSAHERSPHLKGLQLTRRQALAVVERHCPGALLARGSLQVRVIALGFNNLCAALTWQVADESGEQEWDPPTESRWALRISALSWKPTKIQGEVAALAFANANLPFRTPKVLGSDALDAYGYGFRYILMEWLEGVPAHTCGEVPLQQVFGDRSFDMSS
jgi:hypothetical protein